jgi:type II secretory pathway pseudopilin PulG
VKSLVRRHIRRYGNRCRKFELYPNAGRSANAVGRCEDKSAAYGLVRNKLQGMSEIFTGQFTAVANVVLAVFAIVTAVLAGLAFRKQAREVADQAEMLDLQRRQLAEQEKATAKQANVLELQGVELRASIEERSREAGDKRRAQAAQVTAWFAYAPLTGANEGYVAPGALDWGATIRNASDLPVFDVRVTFNYIAEQANGRDWANAMGFSCLTDCG